MTGADVCEVEQLLQKRPDMAWLGRRDVTDVTPRLLKLVEQLVERQNELFTRGANLTGDEVYAPQFLALAHLPHF